MFVLALLLFYVVIFIVFVGFGFLVFGCLGGLFCFGDVASCFMINLCMLVRVMTLCVVLFFVLG